mgnify:CR=1 FL=1
MCSSDLQSRSVGGVRFEFRIQIRPIVARGEIEALGEHPTHLVEGGQTHTAVPLVGRREIEDEFTEIDEWEIHGRTRSEEGREGKECRSRGEPDH